MIYLIAVPEESDFDSVGREMPKGTCIYSTLCDGTKAPKRKKNKTKKNKNKKKKWIGK
jgi:hypothetical protein